MNEAVQSEKERVHRIRMELVEQSAELRLLNADMIKRGRSIDNPIFWLDNAISALRLHESRLGDGGVEDE